MAYKNAVPAFSCGNVCMKCAAMLLCIGLLLFYHVCHAVETPLGTFPEWGESPEQVIRERQIEPSVSDEAVSLLFDISVQAVLTRETTEVQKYTVLYSFFENRLIEYVICLEDGDSRTYDSIRAQLSQRYTTCTDELFFHAEDVFVDNAGKTGVFLLKNERGDPILYFFDMETYASIKGQNGKKQGE